MIGWLEALAPVRRTGDEATIYDWTAAKNAANGRKEIFENDKTKLDVLFIFDMDATIADNMGYHNIEPGKISWASA